MTSYEYTTYPQKNKSLFATTGDKHEVAQIGCGDMLSQHSEYTIGYLYSAIALIESVTNDRDYDCISEDLKEQRIQRKLDEIAMPVCFLFRQYLELTLKDIYVQYSLASPDEVQKMIADVGHNLLKAWGYAKPIIESVLDDNDRTYFEGLESYVKQFHENDPTSMKYRYPMDKKLNLYSGAKKLNLINLKKRMEEIEHFLPMCILSALDIEKIKRLTFDKRNIALKLWDENKLPEAIICYLEALESKQQFVGENHYDVFIGNIEIGTMYLQNEQLKEAHKHLKKSIDIYEQIKDVEPGNQYDLSWVLNYMGLIYKTVSKYQEAIDYYSQALHFPNADVSQRIIAYEGLARTYKRLNEKEQAITNYNSAIQLSTENYGTEHEITIKAIAELQAFVQ